MENLPQVCIYKPKLNQSVKLPNMSKSNHKPSQT